METVEFYGADVSRRAKDIEFGICDYIMDDGRKCAVGRCCKNPSNKWIGSVSRLALNFGKLDSIFMPEYKGHDQNFWEALQMFHDNCNNWNKKRGLSRFGKRELRELLEMFS